MVRAAGTVRSSLLPATKFLRIFGDRLAAAQRTYSTHRKSCTAPRMDFLFFCVFARREMERMPFRATLTSFIWRLRRPSVAAPLHTGYRTHNSAFSCSLAYPWATAWRKMLYWRCHPARPARRHIDSLALVLTSRSDYALSVVPVLSTAFSPVIMPTKELGRNSVHR